MEKGEVVLVSGLGKVFYFPSTGAYIGANYEGKLNLFLFYKEAREFVEGE